MSVNSVHRWTVCTRCIRSESLCTRNEKTSVQQVCSRSGAAGAGVHVARGIGSGDGVTVGSGVINGQGVTAGSGEGMGTGAGAAPEFLHLLCTWLPVSPPAPVRGAAVRLTESWRSICRPPARRSPRSLALEHVRFLYLTCDAPSVRQACLWGRGRAPG